jgi:hypothetical protein
MARRRTRRRSGGRMLTSAEQASIGKQVSATQKAATQAAMKSKSAAMEIGKARMKSMDKEMAQRRAAAASKAADAGIKALGQFKKKASILCRNPAFAKENPTKCASGGRKRRRTKRRRRSRSRSRGRKSRRRKRRRSRRRRR